ncbi:thioredoxin [Allofustis seminis]|uniref:thioredoxin n=1 Tax=Allofustis seminis TaxID=166939 RepID=UPI0003688E01|nr:thioredoxin [Allofustis seminis]
MLKEITDATFVEETKTGLSLTDFWAPWCGPCRMQTPVIEDLAENSDGSVNYFKMNVDDNPETARQYGIMGIPTLLIQKDGETVDTLIGFHSKEMIEEALAKHL